MKKAFWAVVILCALEGAYIFHLTKEISLVSNIEQVDSLRNIISNLQDSNLVLLSRISNIDSTIVITNEKIVYIKDAYEKKFIDVSNQSISADMEFFSDYLSSNDCRFINSNNFNSTEAN